ncbi:alpha/beta fold hydrolase [Haliscomenobacter sp.]|uniref:alpha/beta fold hydrolase n=1 Tax=Haliscomenobacter sp. TaxID=2717303 RepID=UPI003593832F
MKIVASFLLCLFALATQAQTKLVRIKGHQYQVYTKGFELKKAGVPTIIFENGLGMAHGNWDTVIDEIAKFAPVFAYDRAGIGQSDKVYQLPTVQVVSQNLKAILDTLHIAPPYLLVGHSMGGLYSRAFAGYYPQDIAGLVMLDPADFTETKSDWNNIFRSIGVPEKKLDEMLYTRLYQPSTVVDSVHYGPWSEAQVLGALRRTDFGEIKNLPLPNVPIYFFMGGKFEVPVDRRSKDFDQEAFFHVRTNVNIERWRKFIYQSSKGGSLIYLSQCGHFIHRDDPKAIIAHIKFLLDSLND